MANSRTGSVIRVDTTASFAGAKYIKSIKYIGSSSGTAIVTGLDSTLRLWEESGTANVHNADVCINNQDGVTVTLTNSAIVYLYLK